MNVEEARQVLWLKSNQRPLGELLDNGYLTEGRLSWAARKAYDPELKEAAQVLLNQKHPFSMPKQESREASRFDLGISIQEAQNTLWPFSRYKGQLMGQLVASRQLSLQDLGYAIENARDSKVKRAAIALSLIRLEQRVEELEVSSGNIKVVSGGRSYLNWKQLQLSYFQGMSIGAFFALVLGWSLFTLFNGFNRQGTKNATSLGELVSSWEGILALSIVVIFLLFVIWLINYLPNQIEKRFDKQIETYRRGEEGEERAVQQILQALDGNWTLFRNIDLPGRNRADLDIVLVGPPGVWTLEIKNYRGKYRNIGDRWEYFRNKAWKKLRSNPSHQAMQSAIRLANHFKADNLNVFVNPVVVWVSEDGDLQVEDPYVAVWTLEHLSDELGNIWHVEKLSNQEREKIIEKLSRLSKKAPL